MRIYHEKMPELLKSGKLHDIYLKYGYPITDGVKKRFTSKDIIKE